MLQYGTVVSVLIGICIIDMPTKLGLTIILNRHNVSHQQSTTFYCRPMSTIRWSEVWSRFAMHYERMAMVLILCILRI